MWTRLSIATAALLAVSACGGGGAGNSGSAATIDCAPLEVKIDGERVEGLDHALGYSDPVPELGAKLPSFGVYVFTHGEGEVSCEDVLAGELPGGAGDTIVNAHMPVGDTPSYLPAGSVAVGSRTSMLQEGIELAADKPEKEGDQVAICVTGATWTSGRPGGGEGETYEISGLFAAPYCGERSLQ